MYKLSQFWQELKRRNVVRRNTVYAATAFVILELVSILIEPFGLPDWTLKLVVVLLSIGFIISVIISWIYDFNPEGGLEKTKPTNKIKNEDKTAVSSSWKIASYLSFVVIVALIVLNIIPRTDRSDRKEILDKSIAVLPFKNDSPDQEMYFINGTMEEILDNLSKIKDLRVVGRTSVEQYRDAPKPIPVIAEEMNVSYVLEGSGQRDGNNIRLTVQLLDAKNYSHVWSESYYRELKNIFELQSEIAQSIASEIKAIVTPEEKQLIEKIPTTNLTAYDFYQRGREEQEKYWLDSDNRDALERAEDLYHEALEYDSSFAQAYTGLADVYWSKLYWETLYTENFLDSVLILADIALSYNDHLADAYIARGRYYRQHNQYEQAINEYDKAIKFNPNYWEAYWQKGRLYFQDDLVEILGYYQKAASLHRGPFLPNIYRGISKSYAHAGFKEKSYYYAELALKLDNDSAAYYSSLGNIEDLQRNFEKAIGFWEKSYAIDSADRFVIGFLGLDHIYLGQYKESLEYYKILEERLKTLGRSARGASYRIGYAYWVNGFKEEAENYFKTGLEFHNQWIELGIFRIQDFMTFQFLAGAYAFLGDKDKAYEYLRLVNQKSRMTLWNIREINNNPLFESIRDEKEFQQIVQDIEAKYQAEHERVRQWLEQNDML